MTDLNEADVRRIVEEVLDARAEKVGKEFLERALRILNHRIEYNPPGGPPEADVSE
jgi:hypothetical protein